MKQGTEGRGKEIYDPASDAWYWLDSIDGGRKAAGKDVYQESLAGEWEMPRMMPESGSASGCVMTRMVIW